MSRAKDVYETLCVIGEKLDDDHREMLVSILKGLSEGHDVEAAIGTVRWMRDAGYLPAYPPKARQR